MLPVMISILNAVIMGLVYLFLPATSRAGRVVRGALIVTTIAGVGLITGRTLDVIVPSVVFVALLAIERVIPRARQYVLSSNTSMLNGLYFAVQSASWAFVYWAAQATLYRYHEPTWGMDAHGAPLWLQGIVIFLALDFKGYLVHRIGHRANFAWRFHKVHHSIPEMNIIAAQRVHVVDCALFQFATSFLIIYALNVDITAVNLFYVLPSTVIATLAAHVNIDFPERSKPMPWFAYILMTPTCHAYHHRVDTPIAGMNLGESLMIWDVIFGTFRDPGKDATADVYGIPDADFPEVGFFAQQAFSFRSRSAEGSPLVAPAGVASE